MDISLLQDPQYIVAISSWLTGTALPCLVTIFIAVIVSHFGRKALPKIMRQLIRKGPFSTASKEEVKKRRDTLTSISIASLRTIVSVVTALVLFSMLLPNVSLAPIFASAGIMGIVVGFGAQSLIKDFLIGMLIILENQYSVGDSIEVDSATGVVKRINIRSTVLQDDAGNIHYVLNSSITHVINKSVHKLASTTSKPKAK